MTQVSDVTHWIAVAGQVRNNRNLANYIAYTLSEAGEMLSAIYSDDTIKLGQLMEHVSKRMRAGEFDSQIGCADKAELMDAAFDTTWCAIGVMHMLGDARSAWVEGAGSNYSKFNEDGTATLTEDGKVVKGPRFYQPNFKKAL